ncbi:MAG: alanine racemase [Clostridia bacterium]|nr:alanine racemase [Clostridia bacterium]
MIKRTWAEIDLDAAKSNIQNIRAITDKNAKIMAVVKADAYGNGYYQLAKTFLENGADYLAVATAEEGVLIRKAGISAPMLILGTCMEDMIETLIDYDIIPNVYSYKIAKSISDTAVKKNKTVNIHIKLDTGMGRIGYVIGDDNEDVVSEILEMSKLPNINIEGIFSHFSTSDEENGDYTQLQFERFMNVCNALEDRGLKIPIRHICNSAGIMMYPKMHLDMVRPGVILYGMYPSDEVDKSRLELYPVMSLKSRITNIKALGPKCGISYGKEYITSSDKTVVATVPVGYADGYLRGIAKEGYIAIGNKKAKIIGRICMDQCMIDVTNVHNISVGDEVTLFGKDTVTIDDLASWLHTINYEVSCCISKRIPRVYIRDNSVVEVIDNLK